MSISLPALDKPGLAAGAAVALLTAVAWWFAPHPIVVLIIAATPIALLVVIRAPFLLVLGFIVFSFFRIHDVFPVLQPLKIPQLLALAALTTLVWHLVLARDVKPFLTRELRIVLLIFLVVSAGLPFATNFGVSFKIWSDTYIKIAIMTVAIAWLISQPRQFAIAMRVFLVSGIVVAIKALSNKAAGIDLVEGTRVTIGYQYGSPLGDPNDLSLALLFPIAFALALLFNRDNGRLWRATALIGVVLMIAAIIATQSRGGLLGTVAVIGFYARQYIRSKAVLLGCGGAALLALFVIAGVGDRHSAKGQGDGLDASSQARLYAWQAGFHMAVANPLTGVGLGNFKGQYYYYTPEWTGKAYVAHSTWFEMMGDAGFVAFGLLVALIVVTLRITFRLSRALEGHESQAHSVARALSAGLVGFIVSGTFLSQSFTWPLYIQVAMVAALHHFAQQRGYLHETKRRHLAAA